jgi:zinc transport system substrate-binding protein
VAVSIPPLAFIVDQIGGGEVTTEVLVQPGQSHESYDPTPKQFARLTRAAVFFRTGLSFERRLAEKLTASNAAVRVVDLQQGIQLRHFSALEGHEDHAHGDEADPHIWLAPANVMIMAQTICAELVRLLPAQEAAFRANLDAFAKRIDTLDAALRETLAPLKGKRFYVYHPAFGYFGDAYGLEQVAVEVGGKEPSARQLAQFIDRAKTEQVRVIFMQPQFSTKAAETIAQAIGGAVVPMDPLARDCFANLEDMAAKLRQALLEKAP